MIGRTLSYEALAIGSEEIVAIGTDHCPSTIHCFPFTEFVGV